MSPAPDEQPPLQRYITPRRASHLTSMAWLELRPLLERRGAQLLRIAGRERVKEQDLRDLLRDSRVPTAQQAASRAELIAARAERAVFGDRPPRRRS